MSLSDPRLGETLVGRYRLDRLVGKGGMGRVYRATQFPLNRPVAVKILNPEFQKKDPQFVRRFFLEAASAARLSHPNTITVFDYGEAESGELFIAMEFLQGRPLSRVISAEGPFAGERVLHVGMQICRALREAHSKGIIHRDLKPGNILLLSEGDDADFVKVLDFGLVKLFNADGEPMQEDPLTPDPGGELTKAGMFLGSPKYMSPEQIQGTSPDPRTDIYSLGVLMFHMAAARAPFLGGTSVEVIYKHVNEAPPTFASLGIDIDPDVEAVIHRCLAKHRDDRFASMNDLLGRMKDVQRALTGIVGGTETGIEVDLSDLSLSGPRARVLESQDLPRAQTSQRPQTHAAPPARATPSAGAREAPFADTGPLDETGSGVLLKGGATSAAARLAPWAAGLAFVMLLGVLAFVMVEPQSEPPSSAAATGVVDDGFEAAPAERPRVQVRFVSEPEGADVFSPAGLAIGKTPFTASLAPTPEGRGAGAYMFKLDGREETKRVRIEGDAMTVRVAFAEAPGGAGGGVPEGATEAPPSDDPEGDYKANPY